jgi:[protein-PII] uridylyltransferase
LAERKGHGGGDGDGDAGRVAAWRERIAAHRRALLDRHRKGASGHEVCTVNSLFHDELIGEVFAHVAALRGRPPLALCATGSYGRRELAPHSDVDLMFLLPETEAGAAGEFAHETIRLLWDAGVEVAHVARTVLQAMDLARTDPTVKTTFIDLRPLAGVGRLHETLALAFDQLVIDGVVGVAVPRTTSPVNLEPGYPLSSITVLEPNLKESPGALRDFHIALWTGYLRHFKRGLAELAAAGVVSARREIEVRVAVDFLLRLRNELHFLQGRKADALRIELQGDVAEDLGYVAAGREQAIEALLRDYYHCATTVFRFSRDLVARCLGNGNAPAKKARRLIPGLTTDGRAIDFTGGRAIAADPTLLLRAFRLAAERGTPLSDDALVVARGHRTLIDDAVRERPGAAAEFLGLLDAKTCAGTLRAMHECGVLGAYLPEFGALTHLVQYDVFHRFTADEHTLLAVHFLERLADDDASPETLRDLYRELPDRRLLKLAVLLHDVGKAGGPGHLARGMRLIPLVAHRLHLDGAATKRILRLVEHHQVMNELALKRDIHDLAVLRTLVAAAGDEETLRRLYLLTYADMKAVGPGVWNEWKALLLEELYFRAHRQLQRSPDESDEEFLREVRAEHLRRLAAHVRPEVVERYFARVPERFLTWLSPERVLRHLAILDRLDLLPCVAAVHADPRVGWLELLVCSRDRAGLFSRIAGVVTAQGLNILGAQVFTLADGVVLDTFQVVAIEGRAAPEPADLAAAVERDLGRVLAGAVDVHTLIEGRPRFFEKRAGKVAVPVAVTADNDLSRTHTVVEVIARDRPGLLFALTDAIRAAGLNIDLAKINTEAARVVDVFYVNGEGGGKVTDPKALGDLLAGLREIVRPPREGRAK